jgi:hypothetical protein
MGVCRKISQREENTTAGHRCVQEEFAAGGYNSRPVIHTDRYI